MVLAGPNPERITDAPLSESPDWNEENREWARQALTKLEANLGDFVDIDSTITKLTLRESVYTYPRNVGILINKNCGSTTEQFLLAAKQSQKVKLFGTTTAGVLDVSNQHVVPSPCGEFNLVYSLTRSHRIPDFAIDDKGIQPDYFIDKTVAKYMWVDFALRVIEGG